MTVPNLKVPLGFHHRVQRTVPANPGREHREWSSKPPIVQEAIGSGESLANSPERFINRELSWLAFNERVLGEAENPHNPLLERVRFLSISANNLDEFFMVRVAGLLGQVAAGVEELSQDGRSPERQLSDVWEASERLLAEQQRVQKELLEELAENDILLVGPNDVTEAEDALGSKTGFWSAIFLF